MSILAYISITLPFYDSGLQRSGFAAVTEGSRMRSDLKCFKHQFSSVFERAHLKNS